MCKNNNDDNNNNNNKARTIKLMALLKKMNYFHKCQRVKSWEHFQNQILKAINRTRLNLRFQLSYVVLRVVVCLAVSFRMLYNWDIPESIVNDKVVDGTFIHSVNNFHMSVVLQSSDHLAFGINNAIFPPWSVEYI